MKKKKLTWSKVIVEGSKCLGNMILFLIRLNAVIYSCTDIGNYL